MTWFLENVKLSNIRRYGPNTSFGIGRGATILVAPNGTGKTAFFEAIELGLTGKIRRLTDTFATPPANLQGPGRSKSAQPGPLLPMVREGTEAAEVQLSFMGAERANLYANIKSGFSSISGDHHRIFRGLDLERVGRMLPITHLLCQHSELRVFRDNDEEVTGKFLSQLPIGREILLATTGIESARRAPNQGKNEAIKAQNEATEQLGQWNRCVEKLNETSRDAGEFPSLEEIFHRLTALELPGWKIGTSLVSTDAAAGAVETASAQVDRISKRIENGVVICVQLLDTLPALTASQEITSKKHDQIREIWQQDCTTNETAQTKIAQLQQQWNICKETAKNAEQDLGLMKNLASLRAQHSQTMSDLVATRSVQEQAIEAVRVAKEMEQQALALHSQHQQLDQRVSILSGKRLRYRDRHAQLAVVEALEKDSNALQTQRIEAFKMFADAEGKLEAASSYRNAVEMALESARTRQQQIAAAAEGLHAALNEVVRHLTETSEDCPLCGTHHGALELRRLMSKALSTMDPALTTAVELLGQQEESFRKAVEEETQSKSKAQNLKDGLSGILSRQADVESRLSKAREDSTFGTTAVDQLRIQLQLDDQLLSREMEGIETARVLLEKDIDEEQLIKLGAEYQAAKNALSNAQRNVYDTDATLHGLESQIDSFSKNLKSKIPIEEAAIRWQKAEVAETEIQKELEMLRHRTEQSKLDEKNSKHNLVVVEAELALLQQQLKTMFKNWTDAGFSGEPSLQLLSHTLESLKAQKDTLIKYWEELSSLKIGIRQRRVAEDHQRAQAEVDALRHGASIEEHTHKLTEKVGSTTDLLKKIEEYDNINQMLYDSLKARRSDIQEQVKKVEPHWQSLVKRGIRDSRFAKIDLTFSASRGKNIAKASLPLHNIKFPYSQMASEGQATDLHLTFLLAMAAYVEPWCDWKCLLLDDPTQHHDIVSAAAIFDILRDYIADLGFQVIVATHDAMQARYFRRMLMNDGIDVRLYTLTPTESGVIPVAYGE